MQPCFELLVNSKDSLSPDTPWDYTSIINLDSSIGFHSAGVRLKTISFANTALPINQFNNVLRVGEDNGANIFSVTIPPGNYTASEIETTLKSLLEDASVTSGNSLTYTVEVVSTTKRLSISVSSLDVAVLSCTAQPVLGFADSDLGAYSLTTVGSKTVRLDPPDYLLLCSSLPTHNLSTSGRRDVLAMVPITVPFGSVETYEPPSSSFLAMNTGEIDSVNFQLLTPNLDPYLLTDNVTIVLELMFVQ